MIKIKLNDDYSGSYVSLLCGVNIKKGEIKEVDETNREVRFMLEQGTFVTVEDNLIIKDVPKKETIKEVVNSTNTEQLNKIKENQDGNNNNQSSIKEN